jgi:hypothetical protein
MQETIRFDQIQCQISEETERDDNSISNEQQLKQDSFAKNS